MRGVGTGKENEKSLVSDLTTGQGIVSIGMRDTTGIVIEIGIGRRTVGVTVIERRSVIVIEYGTVNVERIVIEIEIRSGNEIVIVRRIEIEAEIMNLMLTMIVGVLVIETMIMIMSKTDMVKRRGTMIMQEWRMTKGGMSSLILGIGVQREIVTVDTMIIMTITKVVSMITRMHGEMMTATKILVVIDMNKWRMMIMHMAAQDLSHLKRTVIIGSLIGQVLVSTSTNASRPTI